MATISWAATSSLTKPVLPEKAGAAVEAGAAVGASVVVAEGEEAAVAVGAVAAVGIAIAEIAAAVAIAAGNSHAQAKIMNRGASLLPGFIFGLPGGAPHRLCFP